KVLSSAALRGRVVEVLDDRRLRIEAAWSGPDQLVRGFGFRLLDRDGGDALVMGYLSSGRIIELDFPITADLEPGATFELNSPEPAPLLAVRLVTGTPAGEPLPPMSMRLATTRGTNALLTRSGVAPVLFVTRGFGDLLEIGNQARSELFTLDPRKPDLLHARVVEVEGRLAADGREIESIDLDEVNRVAQQLRREGKTIAAVALLHADKNPDHERRVAACLKDAGFGHVSVSSRLTPFIKILPRAETAVVNAYLAPVIESYLARIAQILDGGGLRALTSAGGLVSAESFDAKDSLLSGPAGGIAGAAAAGRAAGFDRLLAFDMGGTSTDVARYDGDFEYVFEHAVGDAHLASPALAIESVAAGGGSICAFDGIRLGVGPKSAGAFPGPACYGAGGPLTLTDVNLLLGRIDPLRFEIPIDPAAAERELERVREQLAASTGERPKSAELLEGFLDLANQKMADAIRRISLRLGYDPTEYALVAFGGAGPQHALAVADRLGVETVVIPPDAALLSAHGLGAAAVERFAEQQILRPLDELAEPLEQTLEQLAVRAASLLRREGVSADQVVIRRRIAGMRYVGQDSPLEVDVDPEGSLRTAFEQRYQTVFGHRPAEREIELVSLRVVASSRTSDATAVPSEIAEPYRPDADREAVVRFSGRERDVPVLGREDLRPGARLDGPCLVLERYSAFVVEDGWSVEMDAAGAMVARRSERLVIGAGADRPEAVRLELFTHRFETIAREMGESLRRTAVSTNIKERLDFSCAVLDSDGELVVNAPHIPVHLGSLGLCVRHVVAAVDLEPGDTVVTNHPAYGGSHLPDVTLVSPAHAPDGELVGYVASRAHHAEIGGALPGSMPPSARNLAEEGVVIVPTHLVRRGEADWDAVRELLASGPHPSRAVEDNVADLRAALAANVRGVTALARLAEQHGSAEVSRYMRALKDRAEAGIRRALGRIDDGRYTAMEVLDDGAVIKVAIEIEGDRAAFDFTGSADVHPGNLNATEAIVRSAVLYVLRLLIDEPLPLNEGLLRAVSLRIPPGILDPEFPDDPTAAPAVVGGNVETSQRLVNGCVRALELAAASQGTMNNLLFGDARRSYYETVCGGCGAGPGFVGASAVHSHMTNTRITDPELIEHRYPVRVERFAVRRGSGGKGRFRGGDGVVREIRFLAPLTLSVLSQHRSAGPAGLAGGGPGRPGAQWVIRATGERVDLGAVDSIEVGPDDLLVLETPGGGGYGDPDSGGDPA
ncbi:MAG: hydantoinase B/oxoprolinase family protein, partial [Deltaproteobacteria bacterium]|nr:hydantoinase B/oxoprolinase family protein [Deltaproteobacteria bacterium]